MPYILALDEGTTSARAIVFDETGAIRGLAQQEFQQHYPQPGWVEHDAEEIWRAQYAVAEEALSKAKIPAADIAGIGITNQRETTILWDRRTGEPIARAIVWQDRRTAPMCEALRAAGHEELIRTRTGLVIDAYFSATKIAWLLDNVPGARAHAERGELAFGTIDTWIVWKLTGGAVHVTDASNASRTLLCDIKKVAWDEELLKLFNVPRSLLPEIRSSSEVYGTANVKLLGRSDIPIAGIAGDQQAALFGQRCFQPGQIKTTYGTGCFMLQNIGSTATVSKQRLLTTIAAGCGKAQTTYALEGSVFIGGAVVQWLRDGLGIIAKSSDVAALAATVPDSGGVLFVPAFSGLGAPHWDSQARGMMIGLTRGTTKAHIARAALEAIAFQVADLLDAMRSDSHLPIDAMRVDGGAANDELLMQIQADLLGIPLLRPEVTETTALGAAYLAGLATGVWRDAAALAAQPEKIHRIEPQHDAKQAATARGRWQEAVERAKNWAV